VTLQCPINNTFPNVGTTCGRRERESRREGRREQSLRDHHSFACRGGERHPGLLEGGTLRGASSERGSRSVRQQAAAILRCNAVAPMTADVRRSPRRGTTSACAQSVCAGGRHERSLHALRGRVLRSVLRHVHVDPHYAPQARASVVGRSSRHHGWENPRKWEEPSLGLERTDGARLAACHRFRNGDRVARQKRKEVEASVPARISRARVWLPARRSSRCRNWQAASGPKYARQTRSKKSGQGRVNGGLARGERRRVIPSAGASSETTNRESASPRRRERTGARLRVARDRHPAAVTSPKAVSGRGTGAVRATGSYEESLPMEGIPDHHEASAFTRRRPR
jgi:hypothetical protein